MDISGKSIDEKFVVSGAYNLLGSHGIPLEVILQNFRERGILIDWEDFIIDGLSQGAKRGPFVSKIARGIGDVYGPAFISRDLWRL